MPKLGRTACKINKQGLWLCKKGTWKRGNSASLCSW